MIDDALVEYGKAAAINPKDPRVYNNMGAALLERGRVDEAVRSLQTALVLNASHLDARFNLAVALYTKGDHAGASQQLAAVLAADAKGLYSRARFEKSVALLSQKSTRP